MKLRVLDRRHKSEEKNAWKQLLCVGLAVRMCLMSVALYVAHVQA